MHNKTENGLRKVPKIHYQTVRNTIENSFFLDPETLINLSLHDNICSLCFFSTDNKKVLFLLYFWDRSITARVTDIQGILLFSLKGVFEINNFSCHFQYSAIICLNTLFALLETISTVG